MISVGDVARANNWPGTHGARFLVVEFQQSEKYGEFAWCREFDNSTPFAWRAIPTDRLTVDEKATRRYTARKEQ